MSVLRNQIVLRLVEPRLRAELREVLGVAARGYNIALRPGCPTIIDFAIQLLREEADRQGAGVRVLPSGEIAESEWSGNCAVVLVSEESPPTGAGFVSLSLPALEAMVPSCNSAISSIAEHFGKEPLLDAFDGQKMQILKEIIRRRGVFAFVDAVVQVLYFAEMAEDDADCISFLERMRDGGTTGAGKDSPVQNERESGFAEKFFLQILARERYPHAFAKAALSYFVVHGMGNSISHASRVLNISRTTLQEHLRLAKGSGVQHYFGASSDRSVAVENLLSS